MRYELVTAQTPAENVDPLEFSHVAASPCMGSKTGPTEQRTMMMEWNHFHSTLTLLVLPARSRWLAEIRANKTFMVATPQWPP